MSRLAALLTVLVMVSGCAQSHSDEVPVSGQPDDLPFATQWVSLREDLYDICFADETVGWAVGEGGLFLKTEDGGRSWMPQPPPRVLDSPRIFFFDRRRGFIVGTDPSPRNARAVILSTSDGGAHWKPYTVKTLSRPRDVAFAGAGTGWIADPGGLYRTDDGGARWELISRNEFQALAFISTNVGWAAGASQVFHTRDGGRTWVPRAELTAFQLQFVDEQHGWAAGYNDVHRTTDGGTTWTSFPRADVVGDLRFFDRENGFNVGAGIQRTQDGGETWTQVYGTPFDVFSPREPVRAIWDVNDRHLFAAASKGRILESTDAGATWKSVSLDRSAKALAGSQRVTDDRPNDVRSRLTEQLRTQTPDTSIDRILQVGNTVWAVGSMEGTSTSVTVFTSHDGGERWSPVSLAAIGKPSSMHFLGDRRLVLQIDGYGDPRTYVGFPVNTAPWIEHFAISGDDVRGLTLEWRAKDAEGDAIETAGLSFSPRTAAHFGPLDVKVERTGPGSFRARWKPGDAVTPGEKLYFRIHLRDARGLQFAHQLPEEVTYVSWWAGIPSAVRWILVAAGAIAAYWLLATLVLFAAPLTFVRIDAKLPPALLAPQAWPAVKFGLDLASALIGINHFLRRKRVVRAWLALFSKDAGRLAGLSAATRVLFLGHEEVRKVWIEHYVERRVALAELPPEVRNQYVTDPEFLEVWVSRRIDAASVAFHALELVRQRSVYVSLPMRVLTAEGEHLLRLPQDTERLARLFARDRAVIEIVGEGGVGKSALAVHIGELLLDGGMGFRAIPVILQEEIIDIESQVIGALREAVGAHEVEKDVVLSLLAQRQVVVIFDSLSERSKETQSEVAALYRTMEVRAIIVTTRTVLRFGGVPIIQVLPQKVDIDNVPYFMADYLTSTGRRKLFPGRELNPLADRIMALMETGGRTQAVTPLFLTIFLERACDLREHGIGIEALPTSVPEMVLDDLRRTNPQDGPHRIEDKDLIAAAKILGMVSLGERLVPGDFFENGAQSALAEAGAADGVLDRLEANGVLVRREPGGMRLYRFSLDPIAEYLAALRLLDRLGRDETAWSDWLHRLAMLPERASAQGFVEALTNVVIAYESDLSIPSLVRPALESFRRLDDLQPDSGDTLQIH